MNSSTLLIPSTGIPYTLQEQSILNARTARISHFSQVPWQYLSTHTFTRPVGQQDEYPLRLWKDYIDEIGDYHRDTIGYLWSMERRDPHDEYGLIRPHFHALWVSPHPLDTRMMEDSWKHVAGNGGNPVLIAPFDETEAGLEYVLKVADHPDCSWDFSSNLSFFMPCPPDVSTAQARRRLRRHQSRLLKT
jgi:hypothetical protein